MATTGNIGDVIKPFDGEGDVVAWLRKVELVAKLKKVSDVATLIPLYLEGDALALYLELSNDDQADKDIIKRKLMEAFADGPFSAYAKLSRIRWSGEQVDVYATEIRRLAGLAGFTDEGLGRIVKLTFVNGFPDSISTSLQQIPSILDKNMSHIISIARTLCTNVHGTIAAVAESKPMQAGKSISNVNKGRNESVQCFRCGGAHLARFCKERDQKPPVMCYRCGKPGHIANRCGQDNVKQPIVCYRCGQNGHISRYCSQPVNESGNE